MWISCGKNKDNFHSYPHVSKLTLANKEEKLARNKILNSFNENNKMIAVFKITFSLVYFLSLLYLVSVGDPF